MEPIDLNDVSETFLSTIKITEKEINTKNVKGFDVSEQGIIVSLKEKAINVYDNDSSFLFSIKFNNFGETISFWDDDIIVLKFSRTTTAIGLNLKGEIVAAYRLEFSYENTKAYSEIEDRRKFATPDYEYQLKAGYKLVRTDLETGDQVIVYKNHYLLLHILIWIVIILFFGLGLTRAVVLWIKKLNQLYN